MARTKSWMNLRMFILTFLASLLGFYCSILFYYPTKCIQNSNILRKPRKPKSHPIPIKQLPVTSLPPKTPQLKLISPPFLSSFPDDGHSTIQHELYILCFNTSSCSCGYARRRICSNINIYTIYCFIYCFI